MGAAELMALSLGLSIAVSALALAGGASLERASGDPGLRDRIWGVALLLGALPPLAMAILLLTPAPVQEMVIPLMAATTSATASTDTTTMSAAPALGVSPARIALVALALAVALSALRLAALVVRSARLAQMLRETAPAAKHVQARVETIARGLNVEAPATVISATATEALLSGLGRTRLILPAGLADDPVANAVIAHELAHLKRRDHRGLWLEEALACLLAINPLVPALRARRDAAREEACDALALNAAGPDARRAYADILIEALRSRAGSQSPALTFTGAGRTTAMRRLKAVMTPAAPAGRRTRLIAAVTGLALLTAAGGGTAALAGQREAEVRMITAPAPAPADAQEPRRLALNNARQLLNGQPLPDGLPIWALNPERVDIRTSDDGSSAVDFILPFTGTTPVSVNGQRLPDGFPIRGINPEAVARVDMEGDHMMLTLMPEDQVRRRTGQDPVQDAAAAETRNAERADASARYRRASATDLKTYCLTPGDAGDYGFCAGTMLSRLERPSDGGLCLPTIPDSDGAGLTAYVEHGKAQMARLTPRRDEGAHEYATRALQAAYPCPAASQATAAAMRAAAPSDDRALQRLSVRVAQPERTPLVLAENDIVRVVMESQQGDREPRHIIAQEYAIPRHGSAEVDAHFDLKGDQLPSLTRGRVYTLTAEVRGRDGTVRYAAEPTTIRLAPGSNVSRLRPELMLQP